MWHCQKFNLLCRIIICNIVDMKFTETWSEKPLFFPLIRSLLCSERIWPLESAMKARWVRAVKPDIFFLIFCLPSLYQNAVTNKTYSSPRCRTTEPIIFDISIVLAHYSRKWINFLLKFDVEDIRIEILSTAIQNKLQWGEILPRLIKQACNFVKLKFQPPILSFYKKIQQIRMTSEMPLPLSLLHRM